MGNSWFITACASLNLCFNFYRNCVKYPKLVVEGVTTDDLMREMQETHGSLQRVPV